MGKLTMSQKEYEDTLAAVSVTAYERGRKECEGELRAWYRSQVQEVRANYMGYILELERRLGIMSTPIVYPDPKPPTAND